MTILHPPSHPPASLLCNRSINCQLLREAGRPGAYLAVLFFGLAAACLALWTEEMPWAKYRFPKRPPPFLSPFELNLPLAQSKATKNTILLRTKSIRHNGQRPDCPEFEWPESKFIWRHRPASLCQARQPRQVQQGRRRACFRPPPQSTTLRSCPCPCSCSWSSSLATKQQVESVRIAALLLSDICAVIS